LLLGTWLGSQKTWEALGWLISVCKMMPSFWSNLINSTAKLMASGSLLSGTNTIKV
jgi:hypothetical protein